MNALIRPVTPKKYALTISRTSPSTRETAVEREHGGRACDPAAVAPFGRVSVSVSCPLTRCDSPSGVCYHRAARGSGLFFEMANIKQQKKRVLIQERQRTENLRYRSTIKTLTKRLESAVSDGDAERASESIASSCGRSTARSRVGRSTRTRPRARSRARRRSSRRGVPPSARAAPAAAAERRRACAAPRGRA